MNDSITLREFIAQQFEANDRLATEHWRAHDAEHRASEVAAERTRAQTLREVTLAANALETKLASMNEWRASLSDLTANMVTVKDLTPQFQKLTERLELSERGALDKAISIEKTALERLVTAERVLNDRLTKLERAASNLDGRMTILGTGLGVLIVVAQLVAGWLK